MPEDRRLAAIMFTDIVGYTALMGKDEEATLATLKSHREVIDGLITRYEGRVFGSAGDSVIATMALPFLVADRERAVVFADNYGRAGAIDYFAEERGLPPGRAADFLAPLPIRRLPGVGRRTEKALHRYNVKTIGELSRVPRALLVRTFGREKSEASRFLRANHLMIRQQLYVWWLTRLIGVVWEMLIPVASTALLLYGGYRILQDRMTLGDLTMFLFYMAMLLGPLATLAASATAFQNSLAALDRILDLLAEPLETAPASETIPSFQSDSASIIAAMRYGFTRCRSADSVMAS